MTPTRSIANRSWTSRTAIDPSPNRRGNAVHRTLADIPHRKDPRHSGLERERHSLQRPLGAVGQFDAGPDEAAFVSQDLLWQPIGVGASADLQEERVGVYLLDRAAALAQ
jgi:hypothetical protein